MRACENVATSLETCYFSIILVLFGLCTFNLIHQVFAVKMNQDFTLVETRFECLVHLCHANEQGIDIKFKLYALVVVFCVLLQGP